MIYYDISGTHVTNVHNPCKVLTRYLNKEKLIYLITTKKLYLRRVDLLFDENGKTIEPSYTDNDIEQFTNFKIAKHISYHGDFPSDEKIAQSISITKYMYDSTKKEFYICCFTKSYENNLFWKEYTKNEDKNILFGAAIKTDIKSLKESIHNNPFFAYLSPIQYSISQSGKYGHSALPYFHKEENYRWEDEYRFMFWDKEKQFANAEFLEIDIDLNKFIHQIIPSPFNTKEENEWLKNLCYENDLLFREK